mmetsp:Transcript_45351/g.119832  ORF Transcript_45351/g.119832 Transcript_45351/m.119832 type:complete len:261 (-) Transcript_45351:120-902(-)
MPASTEETAVNLPYFREDFASSETTSCITRLSSAPRSLPGRKGCSRSFMGTGSSAAFRVLEFGARSAISAAAPVNGSREKNDVEGYHHVSWPTDPWVLSIVLHASTCAPGCRSPSRHSLTCGSTGIHPLHAKITWWMPYLSGPQKKRSPGMRSTGSSSSARSVAPESPTCPLAQELQYMRSHSLHWYLESSDEMSWSHSSHCEVASHITHISRTTRAVITWPSGQCTRLLTRVWPRPVARVVVRSASPTSSSSCLPSELT